MSDDPVAEAYLAASEVTEAYDAVLEAKVRAWVRDEVRRALEPRLTPMTTDGQP